MIDLKDITVTFDTPNGPVNAVKDVSVSIGAGEIYGVIGYSGAGKSTLVRTINMLQEPTQGSVIVNDKDLTEMPIQGLRQVRKKIGMIFQHFNLMNARTVAGNVAYPLKHSDLSRQEKEDKINSLLELVGLADKANAYPSQLSGGQKQRVAIARALANDPDVLLCDEATSALDPKTTQSILELLKDVNQSLGLTVVIITHEMSVIKEICNRVAVMEDGHVIEEGTIFDIFSNPQAELTKNFIESASPIEKGIQKVLNHPELLNIGPNDRVLRISFAGASTGDPLISMLAERFAVRANILFGNVEILQNTPVGTLLISMEGEAGDVQKAIDFINGQGISAYEYDLEEYFQEGGKA
ncbi:ATP-binding cassette domain-containing protein [Aerococcus sp. YH-aer221]|uniref:methionine ABC transporter ATP-binding protein n=1 Tax=Aerococcus kribbianus TaxID=2999064 RepID=UPI00228629E0|nr:ATP-binding cassette domain-containing protein [Aerococcus sp. YH-aer221]MCZ0717753.1 ATP-binding cassette domain-containing protein [Aerococcus sp. YH-aer221]